MEINNNEVKLTQEQIIEEIRENTRKTMNFMKWQLYITIILVVLPLLAMAFVIPSVMRGLSSYTTVIQ